MTMALAEESVVEGAAEVGGSVWMCEQSVLQGMVGVEVCVCERVARLLRSRPRMVSRALLLRQRTWHAWLLVLEVERRVSALAVASAGVNVWESQTR